MLVQNGLNTTITGILFDWLCWISYQSSLRKIDVALLMLIQGISFGKQVQYLIYDCFKRGKLVSIVIGSWLLNIQLTGSVNAVRSNRLLS